MRLNQIISISGIFLFFCLIFAAVTEAAGERIGLQNMNDRTVVYCYGNPDYSAEDCAAYYESKGFTRLGDIPTKPARFDALTVDTFPTRRWRDGELTPRW
ncbi:MAG: hypothetical protein PUH03_04820 [bacterium]|nr:hypothetical protein [bacterium]MDY2830658.1 hypothetical protein [Alphaproteobacteria bacterium]